MRDGRRRAPRRARLPVFLRRAGRRAHAFDAFVRLEIEPRGELIRIEVAADGFLHHMVRTIVGTLVECGTGRRNPAEVSAILAACDRAAAGGTAPAHGLYLAGVRYPDGYDSFAEPPLIAAIATSESA